MDYSEFCHFTKKYPEERVQVFIDESNFFKVFESLFPNGKINYKKLGLKLAGGRKIIRISLYMADLSQKHEPKMQPIQQREISILRTTPFMTVKTGRVVYTSGGRRDRQKGVDVLLATDMLAQAYHNGYDTAILVSGDGDYTPVTEEIKRMGKRLEVAFFKEGRSSALHAACDVFLLLDAGNIKSCITKKNARKEKKSASSKDKAD